MNSIKRTMSVIVMMVLVLSTLLWGCSANTGGSNGSSTSNSSNSSNANTQQSQGNVNYPTHSAELLGLEESAPDRPYRIGLAVPTFVAPFWISVAYGVADEAERWGVELVRIADAGGYQNLDKQINQMHDLSQLDLDAILFGPIDSHTTAAVVDDITSKGIKVINLINFTYSENISAAVIYDDYNYGVNAADKLGELLNGKGKVVAYTGPAGVSWSESRFKGFSNRLKEKFPNIEMLAFSSSVPDRMEGQRIMEDWIQKFGDEIEGVFTTDNDTAEGAVVALEGVGRAGQVKIVTSASTSETMRLLKEGKISWISAETGTLAGRWGVQYAIKILNGEEIQFPDNSDMDLPPMVSNVVTLPTIEYTAETDSEEPYNFDWAPKGWTPSK